MITLSEAPSGNAILGGLNASSNLAGKTLSVAPVGTRALKYNYQRLEIILM